MRIWSQGACSSRVGSGTAAEALPEAVRTSVDALLSICGFVVLFSVLTGLLGPQITALAGTLSTSLGMELTGARALDHVYALTLRCSWVLRCTFIFRLLL